MWVDEAALSTGSSHELPGMDEKNIEVQVANGILMSLTGRVPR